MARRQRFGQTRMRRPKVKLPKQKVVIPRPQPKVLAEIYRKTVTANVPARMAAFFEAIAWWDEAINYYLSKSPMTAAQVKKYETANKLRNMSVSVATGGQTGTTDGERINAMERVLQWYEGIWEAFHPPKIKPFLEKFNENKTILDAREQKLNARYQLVLGALNEAFRPLGMSVTVHASDVPREFDGLNTIMLSKSLAAVLADKAKKEGLLPVIFSEAPMIMKALAVERDAEGNAALNFQKYFTLVPKMLHSVLQYCGTVERGKVFKCSPEELEATPATIAAAAPSQPRAARVNNGQPRPSRPVTTSGPMVGGKFKPGSAMATLYEMLADKQTHKLTDVTSKLPVGDPMGRVKALLRIGAESKLWTVTLTRDSVQMTIN